MRSKINQDVLTGILFASIGIIAALIGRDYPMGTANRPGTGVLPMILAWCLIGTGGLLLVKGVLGGGEALTKWAWRQIILVTLAVVAFGLLADDAGLVVAMLVSMTLCALATPETRWFEYLMFAAIMVAIGVGMFIWLLGMPIPIWPIRVPTWITHFTH